MGKYTKIIKKELNQEIRKLIINGDYSLAKKKIDEYYDLYGSDCFIQYECIKYYRALEQNDKALEIISEMIYNNTENVGHVMYELGKLYEEQQEYDKALEIYNELLNVKYYKMENVYLSLANIYYIQGNYEKSEDYLNISLNNFDSKNNLAKLRLAKIMHIKNEHEGALKMLNEIKSNDITIMCRALLYKAQLYNSVGNNSEYERIIDEILNKYDKNYVPALIEKIQILCNNRQYGSAKKIFKNIEDKIERNSYGLNIISQYYYKINDLNNAERLFLELSKAESPLSYLCLAKIEIKRKNLDKAREYLNVNINYNSIYRIESILHLVYIDIYEEKYQSATNHLNMIGNDLIKHSNEEQLERIKNILDIKLNKMTVFKKYDGYTMNQIIDYHDDKAINHIMKHTKNYGSEHESCFNEKIDVTKLFYSIQEHLTSENILEIGVANKYIIPYKNIGYIDNTSLDYLIVVTNIGTKDIITMYPSDEYGEEKVEIEEQPNVKTIKRMSQIDKFNKKYNL